MFTIKERFEKHFPDYFGGAYEEKEDTNLGDELLAFFQQELLAMANEVDAFEHTDEAAALIRAKAAELSG